MKKKNHLKKLALLGITSGIMLASQAEAASNSTDCQLAANRSYIGVNGYRRGNYVNGNNNLCYGESRAETPWSAPKGAVSGQPSSSGQPSASCQSNHGCQGQQPSASCQGKQGCHGQQPSASCHGQQGCEGQMPPQGYQGQGQNTHSCQATSTAQGCAQVPPAVRMPPSSVPPPMPTQSQSPNQNPNQNQGWFNQK